MAPEPDQPHAQRSPDGARIVWYSRHPAPTGRPAGAPVLLLHGLASNATRFEEFVAHTALARQHALIRVDLRGHGNAITRGPTGTALWCADLAAALDAEGGGPALVVGHSLGAQLALQFAREAPKRVCGLVLIDPVFRSALHGRWRLLAAASPLLALAATAVRGLNALGLHRRSLPPLDLRALDEQARLALRSPQAERAFVARYSSARADLRHLPLAVYLQDLVEMFRPAPLPRELGLPVLALLSAGANFADGAEMRAALAGPQVRLETVHCQHWPLTERPAEVRQLIERWIAGLGEPSAPIRVPSD